MPCPRWLYHNLLLGCLLGSLMLASPAWSRGSLRFSLNQLEKLLLGRNSSLDALYYQLESALYQLDGDRLQRWPRLRINYNYYPQSQLVADDSVSFYEQRGEVSLVYPLIDALLNRRYSQQEKQAIVEEKQALLEAGQLELLRELRRQYIAAIKERQLLGEYNQREAQLSQWLAQAKQRYYYKQGLLPEVLDIEALQLTNQQSLDQHRQNYSLKLSLLAHIVGLESRDWELVSPLVSSPPFPDKRYLLGLLDQHPLVRVYQLKASSEEAKLAGSRLRQLKLEAEAGYIVEEDRDSSYQSGSRLGVRFSIPLAYQKLQDYRQLSLLDEQKRWQAEADAQKQRLKQQLAAAYILLEGISGQRELARQQIQQAQEKIGFLLTQMEYPLAEPDHPWQRLITAYQQQWKARERLIELDHQRYTAYHELLYLSGKLEFPQPAAGIPLTHFPATDSQSHLTPRTLYIKNTSPLVTPEQQKFLIQFCQAKGINRILLNTNQLFASPEAPNWLPEFISGLHQQRISVWAIVDPYSSPAADVAQLIDPTPLLTYNHQHIGSEAFDGLHLHPTLPSNPADEAELLKAKINQLLSYCGQLSQRLKALPHPLKLGLSIPHWYDQLDMQLLADSIYYADELIVTPPEGLEAAKLLAKVKDELQLGKEMGRRVWLAVDCRHFSHHDQPGLEEYMDQLRNQWRHQLQFVIFDYQTYQTLEEK